MEKYYTTGKFAKLANVTERTLRYYDKVGLLKPSHVLSNGYRQYSNEDLIQLQKILLLRNLGFSIEEIFPMLSSSNTREDWVESFSFQSGLIDNQIKYYQNIKESLQILTNMISNQGMNWEKVIDVLNLLSKDNQIIESYKNSNNLNIRILLHEKYSTNPMNWFSWIYNQIDFSRINTLLEVGCGNGQLWKNNKLELRNRQFFLSDSSRGMIEDAKKNLSDDFSFMVFDCLNIPFRKDFFDAIIANHVLFYFDTLSIGLDEISRVLKKDGILYASTYGENHMKEITDLVKEFDETIYLSKNPLYLKFGKENGEEILSSYFSEVKRVDYIDELIVDNPIHIVDYILSCHGNQNEKLLMRRKEFEEFVKNKMKEKGYFRISKDACLFIAKK